MSADQGSSSSSSAAAPSPSEPPLVASPTPADKPRRARSLRTGLAGGSESQRTRRSSSSHSDRLSAPPSPLSSPRFSGRKSPSPGHSLRSKRHSIDWSGDLIEGSPPFSSTSAHNSPLHAARPHLSGAKSYQSQHQHQQPPPRFWEENHFGTNMHNGIRELLHNTPQRTSGSPRPESPTGDSSPTNPPLPPPGALASGNALFSPPHALLRQASLASLAPPELSLHNAPPDLSEMDAKWPDPALTSTHSPQPSTSSPQQPPSPPLEPLYMPEARGPVSYNLASSPQRDTFAERTLPTWTLQRSPHRKAASLDSGSPYSSDDNASGFASLASGSGTGPSSSLFPQHPSILSTSPGSPSTASDFGRARSQSQPNPTRRRKRSSRSSISSIGSSSSTSSNSNRWSENEDVSMDSSNLEPASPPAAPRTPQPHLAMPERSGWEYGEDDEDESETGSDADEDSSDHDTASETEDNNERHYPLDHPSLSFKNNLRGSHESPQQHHPTQSVTSPAAEAGDIDFLPEQLQYTDIDKPPPPPTFDSQPPPPLPPAQSSPQASGEDRSDDEDESLSVLERIFILSKSEYREHRLSVTRALPDWLGEVDICEAAEYVLPLLNGLASDDDEVKVGLAQGLDRLMYYFFSSCPLAEDDHNHSSKNGNGVGSRNRTRDALDHSRSDSASEFSELVQPMELDEIEQQPPPPQLGRMAGADEKEIIDPPQISAGAFTPILGLLLMEPNIEVSSWARAAVVRFLCRINDKEIPAAFQDESAAKSPSKKPAGLNESDTDEHKSGSLRAHLHRKYTLTDQARQALEQQILVDVVLGLARLESADDDSDITDQMSQAGSTRRPSIDEDMRNGMHRGSLEQGSSAPDWDMQTDGPSNQHEEYAPAKSLEEDDGWAKLDQNSSSASPDWGMPLRSFQPQASTSLSSSASMSLGGREFFGMSAFDGDTEMEDEATQGKIASLELVSAIALSQCLPEQQVADAFLAEVKKMVEDPAPRVRGIAASALGPLAKALPVELATTILISLMEEFAADPLPMVRRWACLTLPDVFSRLPPQERYDKVVSATERFSKDTSRDVRSALTEICGPLIHLFKDEEVGVPPQILDWYLGKPSGVEPAALLPDLPAAPFAPLPTALSSLTSPTQSSGPRQDTPSFAQLGHPTDPERAMICAYNLPAVALTLGAPRWHELRDFYLALTKAKPAGIRRSLAASLHALVGIVGPTAAAQDLVPVAKDFLLQEEAREVREMILEHFVEVVLGLPVDSGVECLIVVHQAITIQSSPQNAITWRAREKAAGQMSALAAHFSSSQKNSELPSAFLDLLHTLLKDEVAAVRVAAVKAVPAVFEAILKPQARETKSSLRMIEFLRQAFAEDVSYRHRCTFITCISSLMLESDLSELFKDVFSQHFLPILARLAKDPVTNVRMAVARLVRALVSTSGLYKFPAPRPAALDAIYKVLSGDADSTVRELLGNDLSTVLQSAPLARQLSTASSGDEPFDSWQPHHNGNDVDSALSSHHSGPSSASSSMTIDTEHSSGSSTAAPLGGRQSSRESTPGDDYEADDCGELSSSTLTDLTALGSNDIEEVLAGTGQDRERSLGNGGSNSPRPGPPARGASSEHGVTFNQKPPSLARKSSYSSPRSAPSPPPLRPTYSEPRLQGWSPPDEDFVRVEN